MEQALLQARSLIESTVSLHRRSTGGSTHLTRTEANAIGESLDDLIGGARHSVSIALIAANDFTEAVSRAMEQLLPDFPPAAGRAQDRSVAVRVLCAADAVDTALDLTRRLCGLDPEVRVSEGELREALVVDGRGALVRSAAHGQGGNAAVVSELAVVRALDLLFAGAWSRARPLVTHLGLSPRLGAELAQSILERLQSGHTDEAAAQELGVSLRTYRRHVAEIMRELGATSRFQAGVRAVQLGLLSMDR
ncbi:LuxR C-terminal-related transcriptional regulator [Kitasatospora sp. NPDC101155]|jgi:DNA-binding CsgD family transcriptional regulator|uniref:helix-turn-helix transcriptional regulator n=1 Tax=Kitasatospora sp. NPDC101155 TaxID=3364097 RepID=UPI003816B56C